MRRPGVDLGPARTCDVIARPDAIQDVDKVIAADVKEEAQLEVGTPIVS